MSTTTTTTTTTTRTTIVEKIFSLKELGSKNFSEENYENALNNYMDCLGLLHSIKNNIDIINEINDNNLEIKIINNIAFMHLKLYNYYDCIEYCHQITNNNSIIGNNDLKCKAWIRCGQAYTGLGLYHDALTCFESAKIQDTNNSTVDELIRVTKQRIDYETSHNSTTFNNYNDNNNNNNVNNVNNWFNSFFNPNIFNDGNVPNFRNFRSTHNTRNFGGGDSDDDFSFNNAFQKYMPDSKNSENNNDNDNNPDKKLKKVDSRDEKMPLIIDQWFRESTDREYMPPGLPEMIMTFQGDTFYDEVEVNLSPEEKQSWLELFTKYDKSLDLFGKIMISDLISVISLKSEDDLTEEIQNKILTTMYQEGYLFRPIDHQQWLRQQQQQQESQSQSQSQSQHNDPKEQNSSASAIKKIQWLTRDEFLVFIVRWNQEPKGVKCKTQ